MYRQEVIKMLVGHFGRANGMYNVTDRKAKLLKNKNKLDLFLKLITMYYKNYI